MNSNLSKNEQLFPILFIIPCVFASFFAGLYTELFFESIGYVSADLLAGSISVRAFVCFLSFSSFWGLLLYVICFKADGALDYFCTHRYQFLISLFVLLILFNINFSSIGIWGSSINGGNSSGLLFGTPRIIRTDEYNVSTLWNIAQCQDGCNPVSSLLAGGNTDTRFVYNSASWSLITIFRPSLWGYLLFGASRGLSWFWAFKYVFLFLSAYDCSSVFLKNKKLIVVFSSLICFSPLLMWWDGWDGLIFGQYLVAIFSRWLSSKNAIQNFLCSVGIAWLCGCYLFVLYPAWMVPFFFIFALMGLSYFFSFIKNDGHFSYEKIVSLLLSLILLVFCVVHIFAYSSESVKAMSSTVYPGARFSTGGDGSSEIMNYGYSLFFAIQQPNYSNACALSSIFCLFPLGTFFGIASILKNKNKHIVPFLFLQLFLFVFICFGVPAFISKISLFYNVPTDRAVFPFGYLEVFILCYSLDVLFSNAATKVFIQNRLVLNACGISLLFSFLVTILTYLSARGDFRFLFAVMLFLVLFSVASCVFFVAAGHEIAISALTLVVLSVMLISGLSVHPIQKGISPVDNSNLSNAICSIENKDEKGLWAVEENPALGNYVSANGARCLTTTEGYPKISLWRTLDPAGKYEKCYNRYAHVSLTIGGNSIRFKLEHEDHFRVTVPLHSLKKLGIKYLLSSKNYSSNNGKKRLQLIRNIDGYFIYKVK